MDIDKLLRTYPNLRLLYDLAQSRRVRWAIVVVVTISYMAAFNPLYSIFGIGVTTLSVMPVIITAWFFGVRAGLASAVICSVISVTGLRINGWPFSKIFVSDGGILGIIVLVGTGLLVGWLRGLRNRVKRELVEHIHIEQALRDSQHLLEQIAETTPNLVSIIDIIEKRTVYSNRDPIQMLGYTPQAIQSMDYITLIHPDDRLRFEVLFKELRTIVDDEVVEIDYRIKHANGQWRWLLVRYVVFNRTEAGLPKQIFCVAQDITERKLMEEKLRHLSSHDAITGLYNRTYFDTALARLDRGRQFPISIVVADIDELKAVNDSRGHATGDELLRRAAAIFAAALRADDIVARIGGDEFAVLLPQTDATTATRTLGRIRSEIQAHNIANQQLPPLNISLGTSTAVEGGMLVATLVQADDCMYEDKLMRRGTTAPK